MSAVQERLEEATKRGRKLTRRGRRNIEKQLKQLEKRRRQLAKQAAKRAKGVRRQLPGQSGPLDTAKETTGNVAGNVGKTLAAVGAVTAARARDVRKQLPGQSSSPLETARDTVKETTSNVGQTLAAVGAATVAAAAPLIERARSGELQEQARERAAELTGRVREDLLPRVREEYVPQVREAAQKAGTRVSELATTGVEASRTALQNLASSDAAGRAGELAEEAGKRGREAAEEARKRARRGGSVVTTTAGRAVGATGSALKETTLIAFWATALGAIVYYVFLSDEQREKVAGTARSLFEQAQELIRDFQGYDEEF